MTDERKIFETAAQSVSPAMAELSFAEWAALPLAIRVTDRLVRILVTASEIRAELEGDEAEPVAWIAPELDDVLERVDDLLQRLAS
jgi:hypothetical protein